MDEGLGMEEGFGGGAAGGLHGAPSAHHQQGGLGGAGGSFSHPPEMHETSFSSMRQLIREAPDSVLHIIEHNGVRLLGEFEVRDSLVFKAFDQATFLTMAVESPDFDYERTWKLRLQEMEGRGEPGDTGWSSLMRLQAHLVNLPDAAAKGSAGLLRPLLRRHYEGGMPATIFALPAVQAVIQHKWNTWAQRLLLAELCAYLIWLACFSAWSVILTYEDHPAPGAPGGDNTTAVTSAAAVVAGVLAGPESDDYDGWPEGWNPLALLLLGVSTSAMLPFLYTEACTIPAYGLAWLTLDNLADAATYALQCGVLYGYCYRREVLVTGGFSVLVAAQLVLLWTRLQRYLRVLSPRRNMIFDTVRLVMVDVRWFMVVMTVMMAQFAFAFYALYRNDRDKFMYYQEFTNIWHSLCSCFMFLLQMFDYSTFYQGSSMPGITLSLFLVYSMIAAVLLCNLLVAAMASSFQQHSEDTGLRLLLYKAQICDELEAVLPGWLGGYRWHPRWLSVLTVSPASSVEVSMGSLWTSMGALESSLMGAQEELHTRVEELESHLHRLTRKMSVALRLVHTTVQQQQQRAAAAAAAAGAADRWDGHLHHPMPPLVHPPSGSGTGPSPPPTGPRLLHRQTSEPWSHSGHYPPHHGLPPLAHPPPGPWGEGPSPVQSPAFQQQQGGVPGGPGLHDWEWVAPGAPDLGHGGLSESYLDPSALLQQELPGSWEAGGGLEQDEQQQPQQQQQQQLPPRGSFLGGALQTVDEDRVAVVPETQEEQARPLGRPSAPVRQGLPQRMAPRLATRSFTMAAAPRGFGYGRGGAGAGAEAGPVPDAGEEQGGGRRVAVLARPSRSLLRNPSRIVTVVRAPRTVGRGVGIVGPSQQQQQQQRYGESMEPGASWYGQQPWEQQGQQQLDRGQTLQQDQQAQEQQAWTGQAGLSTRSYGWPSMGSRRVVLPRGSIRRVVPLGQAVTAATSQRRQQRQQLQQQLQHQQLPAAAPASSPSTLRRSRSV